jgi:hypothetical protein
VVVADECPELTSRAVREELERAFPRSSLLLVDRGAAPEGETVYERVARLRNIGIDEAHTPYVGHLDDDNTLDADHAASLVALLEARPDVPIAHSWRRLVDRRGDPVRIGRVDPWHPNPRRAATSFAELAALKVLEEGSDVVRDGLHPTDRGVKGRIDTSELLLDAQFHREVRFVERFDVFPRVLEFSDDFVFSQRLVHLGVDIVCSRRPTLRYTMGGPSNAAPA